jgi:thioester reductase-like protein
VAYVVPKTDSHQSDSSTPVDSSYSEQIQQWSNVWNATYTQSSEECDPTFNFTGWNDSFTGLPMPAEEVREWVDCTVKRILSLRPQRVLEIGCGMGLLLFRIAPHCTYYSGIDLSVEAINNLKQRLSNSKQDWSHVDVAAKSAHELEGFELGSFDTIIINSVIQYFPNVDYLVQVLEKAVTLVKPGGQIFIGDVRSLTLLEAFHTGVQLAQAPASLSSAQLRHRIQERMAQDRELVIHPDFFDALKRQFSRISHVQTLLKRGRTQNELTRFRSDVILHVETKIDPVTEPLCMDWEQQQLSISKIRQFLQKNEPEILRITNIPDARIFSEVKAVELLANDHAPETVEKLKKALKSISTQADIHPENFWDLTQDLTYNIYITWTESKAAGKYDVVLQHKTKTTVQSNILVLPEQPLKLKPWNAYANNPLQVNEKNNLVPELRMFLKEKLPQHMIPSTFVVIDSLPLTPNGKIDRRALPDPKKERPILNDVYITPSTSLEKQLAEIWSEILEINQIGIKDNFFELGGHSLLATQLLARIEEVLQVSLPIFYLLKEPTIAGLIEGINNIQNSGSAFPIRQKSEIDWQVETTLDPTIQPEIPFTESTSEPEHIFLTGATGFLGAFLLDELLQQTKANIYCLVRSSSSEKALQKIQTNLERYLLWNDKLSSRIIPVVGDLSQPLLGLTKEKFRELGCKLDMIYHCGAFVNLVYPYSTLRAANVFGTQEILRLASQGRVTPVHFVSTVDVLKPLIDSESRIIREDEHHDLAQNFDDGYAQSKWVAEKLIIAARSRGIPTCIYRPGMLTGHSQTGASQTNDLMCRIIKGMIQLGVAPDLDQWINLTPIDYGSKAIVHLSRQHQSLGKAFHLVNPNALSWRKLFSEIKNLGYPIQILPHDEWKAKLLKLDNCQENALNPMRSLFTEKAENQMTYLESFLLTAQLFDCQNTLDALAETSVICSPVDTKLLNIYFSYLTQSGFLKPPVRYTDENKYALTIKKRALATHNDSDEYEIANFPSTNIIRTKLNFEMSDLLKRIFKILHCYSLNSVGNYMDRKKQL